MKNKKKNEERKERKKNFYYNTSGDIMNSNWSQTDQKEMKSISILDSDSVFAFHMNLKWPLRSRSVY